MTGAGLPHSDTLGSQLGWQLPEAYRSLPRPSSAPDAKTSTACPYTLTTRTIKMLASTMHFSKNNHANQKHATQNNRQQQTPPEKTTHQHPQDTPPTQASRTPQSTNQARSLRTQQCTAPHPKHHPTPSQNDGARQHSGKKQVVSVQTPLTQPGQHAPTRAKETTPTLIRTHTRTDTSAHPAHQHRAVHKTP